MHIAGPTGLVEQVFHLLTVGGHGPDHPIGSKLHQVTGRAPPSRRSRLPPETPPADGLVEGSGIPNLEPGVRCPAPEEGEPPPAEPGPNKQVDNPFSAW